MKYRRILRSTLAIVLAIFLVLNMNINFWTVESEAAGYTENDFENAELLVVTDDASIFREPATILSEYEGVYLLGFDDSETAMEEYYYYNEVALLAEPNMTIIKGADEESTPGDAEIIEETGEKESGTEEAGKETESSTGESDSFAEGSESSTGESENYTEESEEAKDNSTEKVDGDSEEESKENLKEDSEDKSEDVSDLFSDDESEDVFSVIDEYDSEAVRGSVALIDTGASGAGVVGSVSVLGDSPADDNGHGTKLLQEMVSANPEVRVFSIKALDSNCTGTVADVYAAIMLAAACDVKVINLSMSSIKSADSEILEQAISVAIGKGIIVVAAAGNKSMDASLFTPANIPGVVTVGACDESGERIKSSNYGDCVDYYITADSTSVAAAIYSATLPFHVDEPLGETPSTEGDSSDFEKTGNLLTTPLNADELLMGTAEGTVPMWNGLTDSGVTNWLTAVSTGTGRYYYTLTDGGGIDWNLYCIDPEKRCPVDSSVTMYAEPLSSSAIPASWFRGVMAVLYYGKHAESTGKYSYNDWSTSFSGGTSTADRTHWAASYAAGWSNSASPYFADAVSNYNMCLSWLSAADTNGDGIFYVGNGGSSEGEAGSAAYSSFINGTGYHVVLDTNPSTNVACYQGFKVVNSSNESIVHSSSTSSGARANATITYSGTRQYTNWMKLVPYYTGTYSSKFSEQSVQFRVPAGTTVTVKSTSGTLTDYSEGQLVTVWGWYEFRLSAPITKSGNIFADGGVIRLDNRTLFIEGWIAEPGSGEYQRLAYAYTPDWNQYFSLGSWSPRGMITVKKGSQNPYSLPSMDGITYGLYSDANCTSRIGVYTLGTDGNVKSVSVDDNSVGAFYDPSYSAYISGLPTDTNFYVKEISKGNTSYRLNSHVYTARLTGSTAESLKLVANVKDMPDVYAEVKKSSSNTFVSLNNPNYDLTGTTFTVYKNQACTEQVGTIRITGNDGASTTLKLTDHINIDPNTGLGLETTFYFKETVSGRGYAADSGVYSFKVNPATTDKFTISRSNNPYFMPVNISVAKRDATGNYVETEDSTLEGAEFTLRYYPQDITSLFDKTKAAKASMTFATKKQGDGSFKVDTKKSYLKTGSTDYFDANGNLKLPLGYITISETAAPEGYTSEGYFTVKDMDGNLIQSDNGTFVFKVTASGLTTVSGKLINQSSFVKEDEPVRADIELTKLSLETDEPMEGVKFLITNKETGQSVSVCTNEGGYYSSSASYIKHSVDTNGGSAGSGTWFGDTTKVSDSRCALHVGTYTVKEQRTDANGNKQLELVREFVVDKSVNGMTINVFDGSASSPDGKNYNADKPEIHTMAYVPEEDTEEGEKDEGTEEIPHEDVDVVNKTLSQVSRDDLDVTNQTVVDTVYYSNLRAGKTYTLKAELMVVDETGEVTHFLNGEEPYVRYKTFEVDTSYGKTVYEKMGEVEVTLDGINPLGMEGKRLVVYETLYYGGREDVPADDSGAKQYEEYSEEDDMDIFPVIHKDPSDESQTIRVPDIYTSASDVYTSDHVAFIGEEAVLTDVVYYSGLTPGKLYTVSGQLMIKNENTNESSEDESEEESGGSEEELDESEEESDEDNSEEETEENEPLLDKEGNPIIAQLSFVPESESGFVELEFNYDASLLYGNTVVAFETLFYKGKEIAVHMDINDEEESIHYPSIHTTSLNALAEGETASAKEVLAEQNSHIKDVVHYENLLADRKYLVRGTLVDRVTKEVLKDAAGNDIRGEAVFRTEADESNYRCDGEIDVVFDEFDATILKNTTAVIFEEIYLISECTTVDEDGNIASSCRINLVGEHKDENDENQFITFAQIGTSAKDSTTGIKLVPEAAETILEDTVTYRNLIPGEEYTLTATVHVKNDESGFYSDGAVLLDKTGEAVTVSKSFVPEETDGEVIVEIPLDTEGLSNLDLVVFEYLKNNLDIGVAMHEEITDENQTVQAAGGRTLALSKDTSLHSISPEKDQIIVDTVYYSNLIPGCEYTVTGTLMDKVTGKAIVENGKEITSTLSFTPEDKAGTVELKFAVNAEGLEEKTIVVFETVTFGETIVFSHKDLEDEDQSIYVNPKPVISEKEKEDETEIHSKKEETDTRTDSETEISKDADVTEKDSTEIKTGDVINVSVVIAICMLSFAGVYIIYLRRKKRVNRG